MLTTLSNPAESSEFDTVINLLKEERNITFNLLIDLHSSLRKLKEQSEKEDISTPFQEPISILDKLYVEMHSQKENNAKLNFITTQLKQII